MISVFFERLPGKPLVPLLFPNIGREVREPLMFLNNAFKDLTEPFVSVTADPSAADYHLLPHNYSAVRRERTYLHRLALQAARHNKRIIVFAHGDSSETVRLPNATVFRTSQYRSMLKKNEIIMPAYSEDLLGSGALAVRPKSDLAVVGFCGWAGYSSATNQLATYANAASMHLLAFLLPFQASYYRARLRGLLLRRRALKVLRESSLVRTNFLIRDSYSGHADTIRMDPEQARAEYVMNLRDCDFALAIKGGGNYSLRFFEALSLGRIPLLIDTETVLPMENIIDYSSFILKVPQTKLWKLNHVVADFWRALTPEQYAEMQRKAREAFETHLSVKSFLHFAVDHLL